MWETEGDNHHNYLVVSGRGVEHQSGRDWRYRYHLGSELNESPSYSDRSVRDAVISAAKVSPGSWLNALPTAVRTWMLTRPVEEREEYRAQDAEP